MATHSIGTGGDFSTPQLWEDDIPGTLTEDRIGQCKNQEFTSTIPVIEFSAHVAGSFVITLECQTGASFKDNANVRTNALRYNASNGAGLRATADFQTLRISGVCNNLTIRGLQFACLVNNYSSGVVRVTFGADGSANALIKDCIFESNSNSNPVFNNSGLRGNVVNCLMIQRHTAGNGISSDGGGTINFIECTIVRPSNVTAAGTGISRGYGTVVAKDCAIFGFSTDASGLDSASDYNATAKSSGASGLPSGGGHNVYSVTYDTTLFVQPSDAGGSHDFRLVAGNGLENAGVYDGTNAPADISGTTRNNPPEIGVWELASTPSGDPRKGDFFSPMTGF